MLFFFFCNQHAFTQTEEELFEKVFGKSKSVQNQHLVVPLIIENQIHGEITSMISDESSELRVDADNIIIELEKLVAPDVLNKIRSKVDEGGLLKIEDIQNAGLNAFFDRSMLEFHLEIPPELRKENEIAMGGGMPAVRGELIETSTFSAYCNIHSSADYFYPVEESGQAGYKTLQLQLDNTFKIKKLVLETGALYTENAEYPWQLGNTRFIYDDTSHMIRYSIGQIGYPVIGFQRFEALGGFTMARNVALQPYRVTRPGGETTFFIERPSKVEVFLNDRLVRTLQLPAGTHNLQGFSFYNGCNDVRLKITDNVGRVEELHFPFFYDSELLAPGEHQFAYSAGFPYRREGSFPVFEPGVPTFSLLSRFPLNDTLMAGGNLQGSGDQLMLGAESLWAAPIGTFGGDLGFSVIKDAKADFAARLKYRYFNAGSSNRWNRTWSFVLQYKGPSFGALGELYPLNKTSFVLSGGYSQGLPWKMRVNMGATYRIGRYEYPNSIQLNLFLGKKIKYNTSASLNLNYVIAEAAESEWSMSFVLLSSFGGSQHRVRTKQDIPSREASYSWQYVPKNRIGGIGGSAEVYGTPGHHGFSGGASYSGYRFESDLSHDVAPASDEDNSSEQKSSLQLRSAIVFADGNFSLSRPVRDSFAMVVPHSNIKNYPVEINPVAGRYSAKTGKLLPAVLPDVTSYYMHHLSVDAPELPLGYSLGPEVFSFIPGYKSGTVIRVGTDANVLLDGIIQYTDGTPASLSAGKIKSVDDPNWKARTFFTNRSGRFRAEGFKPGKYRLYFFDDPLGFIIFNVPDGVEGIYNLGTLELPSEEQPQSFMAVDFAEADEKWLDVLPAGEELFETEPGMEVSVAFLVTNKSKKSRVFISSVILPEGWKLLFKDFPFELEPGETDVRQLSFLIPQGTPAGTYKLIYTVKRKDIIIVRESSAVFIKVLPVQ